MLPPSTSPEGFNKDIDDERVDIGDEEEPEDLGEEPEDLGDEEPEDLGDDEVEEAERKQGMEGLDLEMAEEDGIGYQDEQDGEHETGGSPNGPNSKKGKGDKSERESSVIESAAYSDEKEEKNLEDTSGLVSRPPHGSEVFVGGITKDTTEEDLKELCLSCGEVFEVRLLKDKEKGENKGYAFVTFMDKETADNAIETLNNSELKGRKLRFSQSQSKHRLFIGNIPKIWGKDELEKALVAKGPGVESIELLMDPQNPGRNRGFAFVEYHNHACAEYARKNMSKPGFKLGTNTATISWADPRTSDAATLSQVKVVYVKNLPDEVTQEQLRKLFEHHGEITKVVLPPSKPGQPKRDFGFIHFAERSCALKAIEKTEKYELEGRELEVSLAKPPVDRKTMESSFFPTGAGILRSFQGAPGYGYSGSNMYGNMGGGAYNQPLIYGRGPTPAGMTMVPMMLPDGRVGYVLQQPGSQAGSSSYRSNRGGHGGSNQWQSGSGRNSSSSGNRERRYAPY